MKKIAIITAFRDLYNYGQILQAYALCTYLNSIGHNAYLIDFAYDADWHTIEPVSLKSRLKFLIKKSPIFSWVLKRKDKCQFLDFKKKHIVNKSKTYYSYAALKKAPPEADVYITGSDQIWGSHTKRLEPFFLSFGSPEVRRLAYAPSFGAPTLSKDRVTLIKPLIAAYDAVGVRESSGKEIARSLGYEKCEWVPDPTILLEKSDWIKIASTDSPFKEKKHLKVFVYIIGKDNDSRILKFAYGIKNSEIVVASDHPSLPEEKQFITIPQWLRAFEDCDYVITNSFHGTMFSLIFRKPFLTFERIGRAAHMNVRVQSIIKKVNLPERLVSADTEPSLEVLSAPLPMSNLDKSINEWREVGTNFLSRNI